MALTPEQLEERRSGVGGSDAATILGINPFTTAYELYLEKIGEAPETEDDFLSESRYWGSAIEPAIIERYARDTGYKVQKVSKQLRSKKHHFMIAHVDARVVGQDRRIGFEAKTSAYGDGWGESGSDEIPAYIMCQVQHYLSTTEYDIWDLGVLIGNRDYRWYRIEPIQHIIDELIDAEQMFWDHVTNRVPPEPQWQSAATTRLIKRLYPGTDGNVVQLPELAQKYHDVLQDATEQKKLYEGIIDGCKNLIAMMSGEASVALLPDGSAYTRKLQTRKEFVVAENSFMATRHTKSLPKLAQDALENNTVIKASE